MLWALRQVSSRPLTVVIDAPLGRLDGDHRQNLVECYFPRASQHVILGSTGTDVDAEFFAVAEYYNGFRMERISNRAKIIRCFPNSL